jgi:hypothetical protein
LLVTIDDFHNKCMININHITMQYSQHNTSFKRIDFYRTVVTFISFVCIKVVVLDSNIHLSVIVWYISASLGLQMVCPFSVLSICFLLH